MPQQAICLDLLESTGTQLYAGLVPVGSCTPTPYTVVLGAAVAVGDETVTVTALPVAIPRGNRLAFSTTVTITTSASVTQNATSISVTALGSAVPSGTTLKFGNVTVQTTAAAAAGATTLAINPAPAAIASGATATYRPNPIVLVLAADAAAATTTLSIDPAPAAITSGQTAITYALLELLGGESAPFQGSTELNQVTLLNSGGWMSKSASQSQYNFQWTGYIPENSAAAAGYRLLKNAWFNKRYLYVERYMANGEMSGGTVVITAFSDQVQGAGYVQYQCTFEGHEAPVYNFGAS
jgi:hypothetical protein